MRANPKVLTGLGCASCGGAVEVQEGWTNVTCAYCETPLAVAGDRGITRLMVLNTIDQAAASRAVQRWFRRGIRKEPALKREASYEEAFLAWFPFVRSRFDIVGWVLGIKKEREKRGDKWVTVERPVENEVERSVDRTMAAANMAEFGVHRVNLAGDELLPFDEETLRKRGMVFRPNRAPDETAGELMRRALAAVDEEHRLHRTTFRWLAVVRRNTTLVQYPLWVFRYSFRGRTYQALIDAEDGSMAYGKAPGNHLYRAFALVTACAGACFVGSTALQNLGFLLRSDNGLMALGALGLVLAALVGWGYSQFRHGGVVVEGTGVEEGKKSETVVAAMGKIIDDL